jgi:hypothetical protein
MDFGCGFSEGSGSVAGFDVRILPTFFVGVEIPGIDLSSWFYGLARYLFYKYGIT